MQSLPYVSGTTDASDVPTASPSASTAAPGAHSVNTGVIAGGVVGALFALAGVCFVVMFFVRRVQKRRKDQDGSDEKLFKRQSSIRGDGPHSGRDASLPPSMLEQRMENVAAASHSKQVSYDGTYINRPNSLDLSELAHSVDLDDPSISPYQAAQHAEIFPSFNTELPRPLRPESGSLHDNDELLRSLDDFPPVPNSAGWKTS